MRIVCPNCGNDITSERLLKDAAERIKQDGKFPLVCYSSNPPKLVMYGKDGKAL